MPRKPREPRPDPIVEVIPKPEENLPPTRTPRELLQSLRNAIELYYDYQQARISYDHRAGDPNETENLSPEDKAFMAKLGDDAASLEKTILRHAAKKLKDHEVYQWLVGHRGIADTFAVILLGMIDIRKTNTASGLWRLCGLAAVFRCEQCGVETVGKDSRAPERCVKCGCTRFRGIAEHPVKGQKLVYSPHLKTRMYLLGESFIKSGNTEYRAFYDDYKARKQKQIGPCMLCNGTGLFTPPKKKEPEKCPRCEGTKQAPWGKSDKHVHVASMRYMVKRFLADFYTKWRTYEGLPVRPPYAEEYHERLRRTG